MGTGVGTHKLVIAWLSGKERSFEISTLIGIRMSGNLEGHFSANAKGGYER